MSTTQNQVMWNKKSTTNFLSDWLQSMHLAKLVKSKQVEKMTWFPGYKSEFKIPGVFKVNIPTYGKLMVKQSLENWAECQMNCTIKISLRSIDHLRYRMQNSYRIPHIYNGKYSSKESSTKHSPKIAFLAS